MNNPLGIIQAIQNPQQFVNKNTLTNKCSQIYAKRGEKYENS